MLGLIDNAFLERQRRRSAAASKRARASRKKKAIAGFWALRVPQALIAAGAAGVTVIEDREGDIYESFALKPAGVEMLVRAAQDRALAGGGRLFAEAGGLRPRLAA